jgi:hypothetical protein
MATITKYKIDEGNGAFSETLVKPTNGVYETITEEIIDHVQLAVDKTPRIVALQIDKSKPFQAIDFNNELMVGLDVKTTFGAEQSNRGLLISKTYKNNSDDVAKIDYEFKFNDIGEPSEKRTVISWYNNDGTINEQIKDKGFQLLSFDERRTAVKLRRTSVISLLEIQVMNLLKSGATSPEQANALVGVGANLMSNLSAEVNQFIQSGREDGIVLKLDQLKTTYTFLQANIAPGVTAIDFINEFLNY